ncbi:MAG: hypothetical protein U1E81_20070 [Xanthobacteraceae bacterium]
MTLFTLVFGVMTVNIYELASQPVLIARCGSTALADGASQQFLGLVLCGFVASIAYALIKAGMRGEVLVGPDPGRLTGRARHPKVADRPALPQRGAVFADPARPTRNPRRGLNHPDVSGAFISWRRSRSRTRSSRRSTATR